MVNGIASVHVIEDKAEIERCQSPKDKPFIRVTFEDKTVVDLTLTLAEMIGAVGAGTNQRLGFSFGHPPQNGKSQ